MHWTKKEDNVLRLHYANTKTAVLANKLRRRESQVYQHARALGLRKSDEYLASPSSGRIQKGGGVGAEHRFQKARPAWNKGLHYMPGGRCREGWFKKGNYSKRWDRSIYCVGALRVNADGGLDIKAKEGLRSWESLARYVWRTERGPIPRGAMVRPINGDTHDTRIENLRLGTRADLMRENTYHRYPKEIARLIQLRGALNRQINRRANGQQHSRPA